VIKALALSTRFPREEKFGLTSQVRRAATSISSNIAEGYRRRSTREYIRYLTIAYGSCGELQSQTDVAHTMKYITKDEFEAIDALEEEMSRLLWSAIETLRTKEQGARNKAHGLPMHKAPGLAYADDQGARNQAEDGGL
jgi:four helix bundle protein